MNKEDLELYVKKSCENILKQLAENPKEMFDLLELQDKYNNLLKEKIELKRQIKKKNEVIDKAIEYINNYNVFKVFSFPLMKRWEEEQIKSSIDYEFKISLIKDLKDILKGDSNECI